MNKYKNLKEWKYQDVINIPEEESSKFEYKSSRISLENLKNKISIAASAFWNSGGGIFIAGVNDYGNIDGGIPESKGKQSIRDWADNGIKLTEPLGEYNISIIKHEDSEEDIEKDKVVLVIEFLKSSIVPHMAYDKKYYIRAGAHSEGANHFQVETLRAFRSFTKPSLSGVMRNNPDKSDVEELLVTSLNDTVAIDVKITFDPFPRMIQEEFIEYFPLEVPIINKDNPFRIDLSSYSFREESFGKDEVKLILEFKDVLGNKYNTNQIISPYKNLSPVSFNRNNIDRIVKAIEKLTKKIK